MAAQFKVGDKVTVKAHAGLKGDCTGEVTEVGGSIPFQMYSVKIDGLDGCLGCVPEECLSAPKKEAHKAAPHKKAAHEE